MEVADIQQQATNGTAPANTDMDIDMDLDLGPLPEPEPEPIEAVSAHDMNMTPTRSNFSNSPPLLLGARGDNIIRP